MRNVLAITMLAATINISAADISDKMSWPIPVGPIQEMTYTPEATRFSLWSPKADSVQVVLYESPTPALPKGRESGTAITLSPQSDGTWTATVKGRDLKGTYYTFRVKAAGKWQAETPGIFAKAVSINGQRGYITDLRTTNPKGWCSDAAPKAVTQAEAIIYEMHHRDFSIHPSSGITNKGKFLALTEQGTTATMPASPSATVPASPSATVPDASASGKASQMPGAQKGTVSTGLDHLKELGVTHVHLLPSYDYGSIDEQTGLAFGGGGRTAQISYNWGYDPVNYNVPEGSYSTDAATPETRIREFKEMVMAMHKAGLRVVLDVVYNHVFDLERSPFHLTAPGYFFRYKNPLPTSPTTNPATVPDASASGLIPANGSGCGNETASEMPMMRKFMVESVLYWMKEYHIDGFRFDLMGIHDIATMNAIREAAQAIDPNVVIYGEGWAAESPQLPEEQLAMKANTAQLGGIAAFGDEMRDGLRGGWQDDKEGAFLIGRKGNEESVKYGIVGAVQHPGIDYSQVNYSKKPWAAAPTEIISYVSCHDDLCLADRIKITTAAQQRNTSPLGEEGRGLLQKLAYTAVLTSQGVPFIWCGDEIMRDKKGVHNSFASPDSINAIDWQLKSQHIDVFRYIQGLIAMRKAHPAFHMQTADNVRQHLQFLPVKRSNIIAWQIDGKAVGDTWSDIIVILNSNKKAIKQQIPSGRWTVVAEGGNINPNGMRNSKGGSITVPPQSATILFK